MTQAEKKKSITQTSTSHSTERGKQARCEGLSVCTGMRAGQCQSAECVAQKINCHLLGNCD